MLDFVNNVPATRLPGDADAAAGLRGGRLLPGVRLAPVGVGVGIGIGIEGNTMSFGDERLDVYRAAIAYAGGRVASVNASRGIATRRSSCCEHRRRFR